MTQASPAADAATDFPWPLTFSEFTFGTRAYNTLRCNIVFEKHQLALERELDRPTGEPSSLDWKVDWTANFIVGEYRMPPGPVEIQWTSLDQAEHATEIDLMRDVFPGRELRHNVPKNEINEDWARYDKDTPEILMEINDRTINVYMRAMVLTKAPPNPDRPDIYARSELVLAWTKTY